MSSAVHIVEVAELDLAFEPRPWQFARTHAEAVARHWARLREEKPEVYNGRVLLMRRWALVPRINGGQIYFPADTPDPSDVFDGKVNLDASARRELLDETGVRAEEAIIGGMWTVVFAGSRIACIKPMTLPLTADNAKARIEAFLAREARPELTRFLH